MHQSEWFQVCFFKNFLGRGSPSPLPRPLPRFFSGFALGSGFALNSRALRALDSGFALDTQALCALDSGFALNFRLGILVWPPPQSKFLDPPVGPTNWYNGTNYKIMNANEKFAEETPYSTALDLDGRLTSILKGVTIENY